MRLVQRHNAISETSFCALERDNLQDYGDIYVFFGCQLSRLLQMMMNTDILDSLLRGGIEAWFKRSLGL